MYKTSDGVAIRAGLRVVTNDLEWGTVELVNPTGWHDVRLDGGGVMQYDGERMTTRHPFGERDPRADQA